MDAKDNRKCIEEESRPTVKVYSHSLSVSLAAERPSRLGGTKRGTCRRSKVHRLGAAGGGLATASHAETAFAG